MLKVAVVDLKASDTFFSPHLDHSVAIVERECRVVVKKLDSLEHFFLDELILAIVFCLSHEEHIVGNAVHLEPIFGVFSVCILSACTDYDSDVFFLSDMCKLDDLMIWQVVDHTGIPAFPVFLDAHEVVLSPA